MADEKRDPPRPFDVRTVEYLLKLMTEHDLAEVELKEGDQRIRLRKGSAMPMSFMPPNPYLGVHPGGAAAPSPAPATGNATPAAPAKQLLEIKSPMVGTFYSKPKPDKPDFISVGAKIKPETIVCLIEAMKLYNDIKAEISGTLAEVCVKNGDFVEYNQVLFRIEPG